jgi:heme-degrading monooxygenase HmoA
MTEHAAVLRIVVFARADDGGDLVGRLNSRAQQLRGAGGNFGSQVCEIEDEPGAVALVSRWRSRQDLDAGPSDLAGLPDPVRITQLRSLSDLP